MPVSRKERKQFLIKQEKLVISLLKRLNKLRRIQNNMGYAPLNPPIRAGWERSFTFRPFVKTYKEYKILETILPLIQNTITCDNKEFVLPKRRHRKAKPLIQNPLSLMDKDYYKLELSQQKYFSPVWHKNRYWSGTYRTWEFNRPQWLDFSIKPHYITKVKLFDADIVKEMEEINDRLWGKENLYQRYAKDKPSKYREYGKDWKTATFYKMSSKEIKEAL